MRISLKITCLVALMLLLGPLIARGQTAEQLQAQIASHNTQIEELNKEIAQYEQQLTDIGTKKQTLQSALSSLDISRKQLGARISITKAGIATTELQIQALNGSISDKQTSIAKDVSGLSEAIHAQNERETSTLVEEVLNSDSISSLWNDVEANQVIQQAVADHIASLSQAKQQLTTTRDDSEKKKQQLVSQQKTLASQQQSLDVTRRAENDLLTQTKSQESNYQALLAQKQASKAAFESALNELQAKLKYTFDPSHLPPAGKGILSWPLDKVVVTQYFGNTEFAQSGAYNGKGHNGIDFRATLGT